MSASLSGVVRSVAVSAIGQSLQTLEDDRGTSAIPVESLATHVVALVDDDRSVQVGTAGTAAASTSPCLDDDVRALAGDRHIVVTYPGLGGDLPPEGDPVGNA